MEEKISTKVNMQVNNLYVVLLVFVLGLVGLGAYFVYSSEIGRFITVSGKSSSAVKNEIASFSVTAEANNVDKQVAVKEVSDLSSKIVTAVKEFGIEEKDIQTTNLNVYQMQDSIYENGIYINKPGNWYASYQVTITLRDITKSADLTAILTGFEKTSIWGPNLQVDNKNLDEISLLESAISDARAKADAMANKVGKRVGGVMSVVESGPYDSPVSYLKSAEASGMGGGGGFPIEAGTSEVQKYVIITYWLK